MNSRQLLKLGVPQDCLKDAIQAIQNLTASAHVKGKVIKQRIAAVLEAPETFTEDEQLVLLRKRSSRTGSLCRPNRYPIGLGETTRSTNSHMLRCVRPAAYRSPSVPH